MSGRLESKWRRGPRRTGPPDRADATLAYNAVRARELMLNQAAAQLERGVVPPLLTLNGGAAAAFLTLLGALGPEASLQVDMRWASVAVVVWVVGLGSAAMAFLAAKSQQSELNKAYRLMREILEGDLFGQDVANVVVRDEKQTRAERKVERKHAQDESKRYGDQFKRRWKASVVCFVLGASLALGGIVVATL